MKKQFQNWAWSQGMKFSSKVHDLTYFFMETTLRCNLKCRHCGSDCDKDKSIEDLPKEKVLQVFRNIADSYEPKDIMVTVNVSFLWMFKKLWFIINIESEMKVI